MGDAPSVLERWFARVLGDGEERGFGRGWMSGTASVFLGAVALLGVATFSFPGVLSSAEFRARYPIAAFRATIEVSIGLAFLLGALSLCLRRRKVLGLAGLALALLALLAGGGDVPVESEFDQPYTLGLDWFLLNLLLLSLVFVPLERAFPKLSSQTTFRFGWATDGAHFLASHLAVQVMTYLTLLPSAQLARLVQPAAWLDAVAGQPVWLQFLEIVLLTDLVQYWVHFAFHRVPVLWRFHAVHHSSRTMDWLAGSRLHAVDVLATRSLVILPVFMLGFSQAALYSYLVFISFHAVFIHANVRFRFGWLERVVATPRGHHWHHATAPVDVNFAVHLPALDRLFGTQHLPGDEWPAAYGIQGHPVPEGWARQLAWPLRR